MGKAFECRMVGDLAATPDLCLDNIEESSLLTALEIADIDDDGLLDEAEFSEFVAGESSSSLFADLYHPTIAGPLRHQVYREISNILTGTDPGETGRFARRLDALAQAERGLLVNEVSLADAVVFESLVQSRSTYWAQYIQAKSRFVAVLDKARASFDGGEFDVLPRQLNIAEAEIKGTRWLWQGYLGDLDAVYGNAANTAGDVVLAAAAVEAVLGGGLLVLGGGTAAGAFAISTGVHGGGVALMLPDYTAVATAKAVQTPREIPDESPAIADIEAPEAAPQQVVVLRTPQELAETARAELDRFRQTSALTLDMGRFLLEANLAAEHDKNAPGFPAVWAEFSERRDTHFTAATKAWGFTDASDFTAKIDAVRQRFYMDGSFTAYWKGQARLSDGITLDALMNGEADGGNCDFRNQALISYMSDPRFPRHADWVPGVQFLPFHVQPVLYNQSENKVWDLSSGQIVNGVAGPVYQPAIMLWSCAAAQSLVAGSPDENLLIVKPEGDAAVSEDWGVADRLADGAATAVGVAGAVLALPALLAGGFPNTVFRYPRLSLKSGGGMPDIPGFAFEQYHDSRESSTATENAAEGSGGGIAAWWRELTRDSNTYQPYELQVMTLGQFAAVRQHGSTADGIVVNHEAMYLDNIDALAQDLRLFAEAHGGDRIMFLIFKNPAHARTFTELNTPAEKADFLKYLADLSLRAELKKPAAQNVLDMIADPQTVMSLTGLALREATEPESGEIGGMDEVFTITLLEENPDEKPCDGKETPNIADDAVDETIAPRENARPNPFARVEASNDDENNATLIAAPDAPVVISPQTMLDFMSLFGLNYPLLFGRWSPSFSQAFAVINSDGAYDSFFGQSYPTIMQFRGLPANGEGASLTFASIDPRDPTGGKTIYESVHRIDNVHYRHLPLAYPTLPDIIPLLADFQRRRPEEYRQLQAGAENLVAHAERGKTVRIISARLATKREKQIYEEK